MEPSDAGDEKPLHRGTADLRAQAERCRAAPATLWKHLDQTLRDPKALHGLADRSSFHANGFVKIVLFPWAKPRIRLHVWPRGSHGHRGPANTHGHRWAFASWIITGSLRETTYVEGEQGTPFDVYEYAGADRSGPELPHRTCRLAAHSVAHRAKGQIYTRERHELHQAEPAGDGLVASLVLQGPPSESTTVYRPSGSSQPRENEPITPGELRPLLVEVTEILQPVA